MKLNYADRRNDKNILKKKFKIKNVNIGNFNGKISLIEIEKINKSFEATRPDGTKETVIAKDYKIMIYFPKDYSYTMTVMYDNNWNLLQWYFDINRYITKYELDIPYSEDLYLDVIALPNGNYYILDEDELKEALKNNLISQNDYDNAYVTMNKIILMIKNTWNNLVDFTNKSLDELINF